MMNNQTNTFEPIKLYREGKFDRKYWYTLQAKRYIGRKAGEIAKRTDLIFTEHKFSY